MTEDTGPARVTHEQRAEAPLLRLSLSAAHLQLLVEHGRLDLAVGEVEDETGRDNLRLLVEVRELQP